MIGVLEYNDCLTLCVVTRNLYCILHSLCAGVNEHRLLLVGTWSEAIERLADLDVVEVRINSEAGVGKNLNLLNHVGDHARCAIADIGYADTGAHIDDLISIDIEKNCITCALNSNREGKT